MSETVHMGDFALSICGEPHRGDVCVVAMDRRTSLYEDAAQIRPDTLVAHKIFMPLPVWQALVEAARAGNEANELVFRACSAGDPIAMLRDFINGCHSIARKIRVWK